MSTLYARHRGLVRGDVGGLEELERDSEQSVRFVGVLDVDVVAIVIDLLGGAKVSCCRPIH